MDKQEQGKHLPWKVMSVRMISAYSVSSVINNYYIKHHFVKINVYKKHLMTGPKGN